MLRANAGSPNPGHDLPRRALECGSVVRDLDRDQISMPLALGSQNLDPLCAAPDAVADLPGYLAAPQPLVD